MSSSEILNEEEIDITPDKSLMEKIGYVGFPIERALAELVDNALDARYDEKNGRMLINEKLTVKISIEKGKITVNDNSAGMENPKECLRLAFSIKKDMLGKFGLGLKTACMSLGRKLEIATKRIDKSEGYVLPLDLDEWYGDEKWSITMRSFKADKKDHWTTITIEKLWVDSQLYDVNAIKKELAFRFSEFVQNNELEIFVNGKKCISEPLEFISPRDFDEIRKEFDLSPKDFSSSRKNFEFCAGKLKITGWIDLLAKWALGGRYGFNIYRGKRLLDAFQKIGIREHPTQSRIFGCIYLPLEAPVKFTKDGVEARGAWFGQMVGKLKEEAEPYTRLCSKLSQKRRFFQVKPQTLKQVSDYLDKIEKAFNNSSLTQQLLRSTDQRIRSGKKGSEGVSSVDIEKRKPKIHPTFRKPIPKGEKIRQLGEKKQKKKTFYITVRGQKIKISHDFQHVDVEPIKMYYRYYDKKENEFQIVTNTHFDSWGLTKDEPFYAAMNIINALSEFIFHESENPQCTVEDIQEDLWKNVGKLAYSSL
jgi:hypothetical protein